MRQPRVRLGAEVRRTQFEHTAIYLVSRDGFRAVTTDAIAQQAGVSKGLLWRYYANMDELMREAAARTLGELEKVVAKDLDLTQPVPKLLQETIRRAALLPGQYPADLRAIRQISNNLQLPDGNQALTPARSYGRLYDNQVAIFRRGQNEGSIRADLNTQLLARMYQGAIDAMISQILDDPSLDPQQYADSLSNLLLSGIEARNDME